MFEQLKIHSFRGISSGRLSELGKVNLLVGPNKQRQNGLCLEIVIT
jgi:hypothetical protein